ncbi:sensor histidine kinase [Actinoplanes sp. NBC_00393]|uniref:sensor histidine kinase n=1 Tax=Actinoplanes sp. NBC_00393 TaxID=2975953 RepID=UPI002E1B14F3
MRAGWRFLVLPLVIWLVLSAAGAAGMLAMERANHHGLAARFGQRIGLVANFVAAYVDDRVQRQRTQAVAYLSGPAISAPDFTRLATGLGFPAAVLLDSRGRTLQVAPAGAYPAGTDLTSRYPHLADAVRQGVPTVSPVLDSIAQAVPVVNFAVPFDTGTGRRVLAGSVEIANSPLSAYLSALPLTEVTLHMVDPAGRPVAANRAVNGVPLDAASGSRPGRFWRDGRWWRQVTHPVPGTPWRLTGAISEDYLYGPVAVAEAGTKVAVITATGAGLLVVAAVARTRRSRRDLQHANSQMTDFITMLSHDVRQPLSSIVTYGHTLLDEWSDLDEDLKHRYVQRITAGGHRADGIVEEILTLAQLDSGVLTVQPVPLDVHRAVREAVAELGADPEQRITMTAPEVVTARADPACLKLILGNLIGNAVKYGQPPIEIAVIRDGAQVHVHVSDHGEGVPPEFVGDLFDRFTRAGSGVATTKPGTGLGLYLVHQLATAGGLHVGYQPHEPRGATFVVTLPAG